MLAKKKVVLTGGGSAGHVTPNLALITELQKEVAFFYIGSKTGIEKELIAKTEVPYFSISSGKLRRYIDLENVRDIFRVMKGVIDARRILKQIKPDLLFSKGGFVSVPVIIAAKMLKIPAFIHESDLTPGLANKIAQRFAEKVFTSFEEAKAYFPREKVFAIGSPIRPEIFNGDKNTALKLLHFSSVKPIITVMGGSLGAKKINEQVRKELPNLLGNYQVVHICGKGQVDESLLGKAGYKQFEYIHEELPHILAATHCVITRGGSNALFEFLALNMPMLIIPLSKKQSRGDQLLNAESFAQKGFAKVIEEEAIGSLLQTLRQMELDRAEMIASMSKSPLTNGLKVIVNEIRER